MELPHEITGTVPLEYYFILLKAAARLCNNKFTRQGRKKEFVSGGGGLNFLIFKGLLGLKAIDFTASDPRGEGC